MFRPALLLAVLTFAIPLSAQEKPDAPKPNRRVFIAGVDLLAASKAADAITTRQLLDRGGVELNPVFGRYPSPAKQAGINAGIFAAQSTAFYFTERSRLTQQRSYFFLHVDDDLRFAELLRQSANLLAQVQVFFFERITPGLRPAF